MSKRKVKDKINSVEQIKQLPRPIVFTNGCFDIVHAGHIDYLEKASAHGATLVVGLNTDASVQSLNKAPERPLNPLAQRQQVIAALESVDAVIAFDESTPESLIHAICPDVLIKGGDWDIADIVGGEFVIENGGEVLTIDFSYPTSTTKLIEKIKKHC